MTSTDRTGGYIRINSKHAEYIFSIILFLFIHDLRFADEKH